MTTRFLVIDDDEDGLATLHDQLVRALALHPEELPNPDIQLLDVSGKSPEEILASASESFADRCDALLVDIWLDERDTASLQTLLLPLHIVRTFRSTNKTGIACLYSGNIQDYLGQLYDLPEAPGQKRPIEVALRVIIDADIAEFLSRNKVASIVVNRLLAAPLPLRVERELLKTPHLEIETGVLPGNIGFDVPQLLPFASIADSVRIGDPVGSAVTELIVQHGIAAVAQVFQLTDIRDVPILCITSDCYDLEFLIKEIHAIEAVMPKMTTVTLRTADKISDTMRFLIGKAVDVPAIVILLHGGDGYLKAADPTDAANAPEAPRWMNSREHLALFRDKVVYCFSCNSITLAKAAVDAGAIAFIGFPDIPFYRFDGENPRNEPELTSALQELFGELTRIILLRWFLGKDTVEQLVDAIRITVRSLAQKFVKENPDHSYRTEVVAMFDKIAQGVDYEGNGTWVFPGR